MALALTLAVLVVAGHALVIGAGYLVLAAERGRPARPDREGIAVFFRELLSHLVFVPLRPLGWFEPAPSPTPETQDDRPPVLMVPGYMMNRTTWVPAATWLRRAGWRWVWTINNGSNRSIDEMARQLEDKVQLLRRVSGHERIDLVGHSMGGVVICHWLQHYGQADHVHRVVTVGSPLAGTKMAVFGPLREARDLIPRSELLRSLGPMPVPTVHLFSASDHLLVPTTCAVPAWASGHHVVELQRVGHQEGLLNLRALRALRQALRQELIETNEVPA